MTDRRKLPPAAAAPDAEEGAGVTRVTPPPRVSIRHVAETAGVSLKTVSRVINDDPAVRPEMRERVRQAIAALNYQSDPLARSLRSAHSFAIGLVYSNPNAQYLVSLQNGVLSACREQGYGLQIHPCSTPAHGSVQELLALVQRSRLAGLVLAPPMSEQRDLIEALAAHGVVVIRIVSAGEDPRDVQDSVRVDDRRAAHAITEHLIQLGHSRIAFLWGDSYYQSSVQRYAGYMDAMRDYGVDVDAGLVLEGEFNFNSGFRRARKLLALTAPPTAVFGSNDEIAAGVLAAARSVGFDVPGDLAIAGFEDSPFAQLSWPPLTTARQDTVEIGRRAALRLIERVRQTQSGKAAEPIAEIFTPELVVRGSTAPPRRR
ncbi:LacI family DNA-binding transcriptional regulator [Pelomonas cellulosilytica]|uniref:LacI family DNA-binding transcriptional regulator n=1 Tax=Pelomonas cellulosilytica TaxID=2906762 RepID=A0ABS8XQI1_9BURK|nr:LacI family DNA-binding transcriptional regulator [Pelomonas sp. P8]